MAGIKSKYGNDYNAPISEYILTDKADVAYLPTTTKSATGKFANDVNFENKPCIGSICQVINDSGLTVYMLGETDWIEI